MRVDRLMIPRLLSLLLWITPPLVAEAESRDPIETGMSQLRTALADGSAAAFAQAAGSLQQACKQSPASVRARHWLACARFHHLLALKHGGHDRDAKAVDTAINSAVEALEAALRLDPADAEAHAMLATVMGMRIEASPLRGIQLGSQVGKHRKLAIEHGPQNPRVRYLVGTILLHTAKNDDDRRAALESMMLAESLYQKEADQAAGDPRWGRDACLAFIGMIHADLHEPETAASYFRRSLAIQPNNPLAKAGLASLQAPVTSPAPPAKP